MAKKYIVADGFIVAGKSGGEEITEKEIERLDILLESGRIVPVSAKSSGTMKAVNHDVLKEDDSIG